jgi:hypothetical protein
VISGPDNVGWILFYSNSNDQCVGNTTPGLSGNCSSSALTKYACGTSFTGWASQPFSTPIFDNATNVYLMVWDMDFPVGNKNDDDLSVNFKARYGCGERCAFFASGSPIVNCGPNGTYTVTHLV